MCEKNVEKYQLNFDVWIFLKKSCKTDKNKLTNKGFGQSKAKQQQRQ